MKFTDSTLKKIIQFGADGYSLARIARELNITPDELRDHRATDEKLNDAMDRSEYNFNQYLLGKIEEKSISSDSRSQVEIYRLLRQKHNANLDNFSNDKSINISDVAPMCKDDIVNCYLSLIKLKMSEINSLIKDNSQTALIRIVGKAILNGNGLEVIEKILDRGIGKPAGSMELTGKNGDPLLPTKVKIEFGDFDNG